MEMVNMVTGPVTPTMTRGWPPKMEKMQPDRQLLRQTSTTPIFPVERSRSSANVIAGAMDVKNMKKIDAVVFALWPSVQSET
jgi:hypothetical protein